jgi:C-type mannose receptor
MLLQKLAAQITAAGPIASFTSYTRTFHLFSVPLEWSDARKVCQNRSMDLATFTTAEHTDALCAAALNTPMPVDIWLGATDAAVEGKFQWADRYPWSYTSWAPGEPNNADSSEHCLAAICGPTNTISRTLWNDASCSRRFGFVCSTMPREQAAARRGCNANALHCLFTLSTGRRMPHWLA